MGWAGVVLVTITWMFLPSVTPQGVISSYALVALVLALQAWVRRSIVVIGLGSGLAMLFGRFVPIVAVLAIAGSLARKQAVPPTAGTFPTGTPLFAALLLAIVLTVVGLTYFPVLSLGPVLEHLTL